MRFIAGCAVLWISVLAASANLLVNPGFETGDLTGWEEGDWWYTGVAGDAHSGTYGGVCYVQPGAAAYSNWVILQKVPVTAGVTYDASVWLRTVSFNTSEAFMEVVFQNNAGVLVGQAATPVSTGQTAYTQYSLNGLLAPASAVTASVRAVARTTALTTDVAWYTFDDFDFDQAIPEPGTLALCLMGIGFGSIVMHRRRRNG